MTQAPPPHSFDEVLRFDLLEQSLENWHDQLSRLSPYLPAGELTKLARRWDSMRHNLDVVFLNYGHPIPSLSMVIDDLPALRNLTLSELELILEGSQAAKRTLGALVNEASQRVSLLEQVLNLENKPTRVQRSLERMQAIDDLLQKRIQEIEQYRHVFDREAVPDESALASVQKVVDQTNRMEALEKANELLENQKNNMQAWLKEAKGQLPSTPATPPPSAEALGQIGRQLLPRTKTEMALESLFANREKLREARRYLEAILPARPEERR